MSQCTFTETTNPELQNLVNTAGDLTVFHIGSVKYISFITIDRSSSFRKKVETYLNDLEYPGCTEAWYQDTDGYEYTFCNPLNVNPLWEMEHGATVKNID